jgi:hypothetical protein
VGGLAVGKLGGTCCAISDGFQRGEADALWRGGPVEAKRCPEGERRGIKREIIFIGGMSYLDCWALSAARCAAAAVGWGASPAPLPLYTRESCIRSAVGSLHPTSL